MKRTQTLAITCVGALFAAALPAADGVYVVESAVGIHTESPSEALHVFGDDGEAQLLVEETFGTEGRRTLLSMQNNGQVVMQYKDTALDNSWLFATRGLGFEINRGGTGMTEFFMKANGDLQIVGTLSQGSSRAWKEEITPVAAGDVLDRVMALPINTWKYKREGDNGLHLGPMAEDFHAAFGLGAEEQLLAPGDAAGVALAAIQGLGGALEERRAEIAALRAEVDALQRLVRTLATGTEPARD